MRVLYLHQHFSTPAGKTGIRSYEFAQALLARGHEVTIVCGAYQLSQTGLSGDPIKGLRRGMVDGIEIIEICLPYSNHDGFAKRTMTFIRFALKSIAIALREPNDVVFATSTPLTAGIPGIFVRLLRPRRQFVFEVRDLWPELPRAMGVIKNPVVLAAMSLLEKATYTAMHAGIALSPGILHGMRRRSNASKRIELIPNGCDLDVFRPQRLLGNQTDKKENGQLPDGFPERGFHCVFTGAHGLANGLGAVLDAAKHLIEQGRGDINLIFIGDGKLKPELVRRSHRESLTNCHFLDTVPKSMLASTLRQCDVGMMVLENVPAFYYGTSPNKFFDYLAAGLPILNNYPGWLADLIDQHKCGLAVPPGNPVAFADALCELSESPDAREAMAKNARLLGESQFDRRELADVFVDFLESVHCPAPAPSVQTTG